MPTFLFKHIVDISLLTDGFHIQTAMHNLVYALPGGKLHHGESREIKIIIEGETFTTRMNNIGFNQTKYPGHPDLLQVRYSVNSPIAKKLQAIFMEDYLYLQAARAAAGPRKHVQLPEGNRDEVVLYGTSVPNVFVMECIRSSVSDKAITEIKQMNELDFETFEIREDKGATIKEVSGIHKIRVLDRSIGDSLKKLYDYTCQMTGEKVGEEQGGFVVEAHHIEPFTKSLNNDTSNIIILSPNYHRIIHKANPEWLAKEKAFKFPNGLVEKVTLNKHL